MTLFTIEAEYIAISSCACQRVWMRHVVEKLDRKEKRSTLCLDEIEKLDRKEKRSTPLYVWMRYSMFG